MERTGVYLLYWMGNPMTLVGPELKVGDKAPEFTALDNVIGKPVHLGDTGHKTRIFSAWFLLGSIPLCATPGDQALSTKKRANWLDVGYLHRQHGSSVRPEALLQLLLALDSVKRCSPITKTLRSVRRTAH